MARNYLQPPRNGGCDVIENILMGDEKTTNALSKKYAEDHRPSIMIDKLSAIVKQTTDRGLKNKANKAIKKLKSLPADIAAKKSDREKIFEEVCP